jgi:hypothetical protein
MKFDMFCSTFQNAELVGTNPDGAWIFWVERLDKDRVLYAVESSPGRMTLVEVGKEQEASWLQSV